MRVLVVNAGSSSLKHALVDSRRIGDDPDGALLHAGEERWDPGASPGRHGEALRRALRDAAGGAPDAVGHRVVHGGGRFDAPAVVDGDVRAGIERAARLAPLHNRAALEGIDAAVEAFPDVPQVACFDTAFHRTLDPAAATYALPREWRERHGIRRFGFHGLSVAWCAGRARELLGEAAARRLVVCHLGSGCSATAVRDGRSCDTTMGFTPLDGMPMATRSGALDPGILLYLQQAAGLGAAQLDDALNHRSGLLGIAGSADLRELLAAADGGSRDARLAVDVFVRGIAGAVAALTTTLGGLDALVFTAGIGEHSPPLRAAVADRLAHLGVALDDARNRAATRGADGEIGAAGARIRVLVLRAREELVVARETAAALGR
ncbi:acetate/propionate family kinase [Conexibacter arvalis]|uniref:Acetate kinase n=1 Tax=Conexibacter arvalis TaxID=912552 RepID=A0A840ICC5_9ACTN|nr:acetate/propionate family kinase [Conexibacter arvalis]MBB4661881.1 acetate kinase [Conexibacter arvalis]